MNITRISLVKKSAAATALFVVGTAPAMAADGRSIVDFLLSIKELVTVSTDLTYSIIMLAGLVLVAGGIIAWIMASKTQNQQQTRGYAGTAFVGGMLLCSILAVINMGSNSATGSSSELEQFYQSSQSSSTNRN
ncbi:hypothetical protein ABXZ88_003926 [Vibrio fluvialis]